MLKNFPGQVETNFDNLEEVSLPYIFSNGIILPHNVPPDT